MSILDRRGLPARRLDLVGSERATWLDELALLLAFLKVRGACC